VHDAFNYFSADPKGAPVMFSRPLPAAVLFAVSVYLAAAAPVFAAGDDPVVATVNGAEIRISQVKDAHTRLPQQYQRVPFEAIFPGLVDSLIDSLLAAEDARGRKLQETPEFKAQMARIEEQVLQRMALSKAMIDGVSDADLRALYETKVKNLAGIEQIKARHILLKTENGAKEVIAALRKGGDFAGLAKEKSTGPSASDGGNLGFFGKGQMVPAFEQAAYALKPGAFTQTPVKTQFGWHVIKVEERKKADVPSFEKMEPALRDELSQEAGSAYITKLRKGAKIARFNADGSPMTDAAPDKKP